MKDYFVVLKITFIGLLVTVCFYPLIHESGHVIATLLTGGKFIAVSWLPSPNVLCEMNTENAMSFSVTSLAGMIFPILFILPFYKSKGSLRFGALIMSGITVLSFIIGFLITVMRLFGSIIPNDDVTVFMDFTGWELPTLFIMFVLAAITIFQFILFKPKQVLDKIISPSSSESFSKPFVAN